MTVTESELMPLARFLVKERSLEEIAQILYVSPSTALRYIKRLRDMGYNVRSAGTRNRRRYVLDMT